MLGWGLGGWVSGCSGDSHGNYSRVTTTNIESLSRSFSRALGLSSNLSFHAGSRTYIAHPFLKSPPYPPPRLSAIIYFRPLSRLNGREIASVLRELDSLVYGDFTTADIGKRMLRWLWIPVYLHLIHLINYFMSLFMTYKQEKKYEIYLRFPFSSYTIVILCNVYVFYIRQILHTIVFVLSIINCYTTNVDANPHIFSFGLGISTYNFLIRKSAVSLFVCFSDLCFVIMLYFTCVCRNNFLWSIHM